MKWHGKSWTRAELEKRLGLPELEANAETRSENAGVTHNIGHGTPLVKRSQAPPPIEGVDRIIAWKCSTYEPPDGETLHRLEGLYRDSASLSPDQRQALFDELKGHLDRAGDRCVASTRIKLGEAPDAWFMFRVCSKHGELDD